ncbi:EAL domain-containing protein [Butyrivibrio sp. MB2005]|uniref:EAL domain-containing protein n=1 Tax=Butyrivibrio sp. MB2005 TaxID=1280678 RepID=UPI00040BFBC8|nr:EAL domain-containing protein [Butyrivibrio sp. MB2005]
MANHNGKRALGHYIVDHIEEAIAAGDIKVYYQPVVRSLTGQLAGAESLARWVAPDVGFLSPDEFINVLEKTQKIHKLDCFMVESVCRDIHDLIASGKTAFPVSVNFSRLDFMVCDMLEVVERAVEKYDIPRDYLHIELTESMIAQDKALMTGVIESFRNRGYEVWIDDFGSGYSSLNLLKDYHFDVLKLDMAFLANMSERSKTIVRSSLAMAKKLGIKTLSEGVETQEQVEFLKAIGCGKLQGAYFGLPKPLNEMLESIEKKGITIEERQWRNYYEVASFNTRDTETSLQVAEYDGKRFKTLFMNDAYRQQIRVTTDDLEYIDSVIYNPASPLLDKHEQFLEKAIKSRNYESFYYTDKGNYYYLKGKVLAENDDRYLFKTTISNISLDQNIKERDRLDYRLRELNNLFEVVLLINISTNKASPLIGAYRYMTGGANIYQNLNEMVSLFVQECVYPDERVSFMAFIDTNTIKQRGEESKKGYIARNFRLRQKDGSYKWRTIILLMVPGTDGNEYLFTINTLSREMGEALDNLTYGDAGHDSPELSEKVKEYALIWENIVDNSATMHFWKDKERRFRGVSQSFLDFYEIGSLDEIIGKTDEEMHWHVDDGPYQGDELDVIGKGKFIFNARGQCIVNGVVHNIICNKMPLYDKGEIVGLVGNFADIDQELYRVQKLVNPSKLDNMTRLMNFRSYMDVMSDYAMQYNDAGRNYGVIIIHNMNHKRITADYGEKQAGRVVREIGEKIIECIGQSAAASRIKEAYFSVLTYTDSREKLEELAAKLKKSIEGINEVNGKSVTIKVSMSMKLRTDGGVKDENIYYQALDELDEKESR